MHELGLDAIIFLFNVLFVVLSCTQVERYSRTSKITSEGKFSYDELEGTVRTYFHSDILFVPFEALRGHTLSIPVQSKLLDPEKLNHSSKASIDSVTIIHGQANRSSQKTMEILNLWPANWLAIIRTLMHTV